MTEIAFSTSAWRMNGMVLWMRKNSMLPVLPYFASTAVAVSGFQTVPIDTT